MIYIIFAITAIINIFNILLISNNSIIQSKKEKVLLATYSIAELVYILFILTTIQYTAANTVVVLSFVIIWLLSKSYILVINMNFDDNKEEVNTMKNEIMTEKYGKIVLEESFWTGRKKVYINGEELFSSSKNSFLY